MFKIFKSTDYHSVKNQQYRLNNKRKLNDLKNITSIQQFDKYEKQTQQQQEPLIIRNNFLFKILLRPRTYLINKRHKLSNKNKYLINEYYSQFNYENHEINHQLLLKQNKLSSSPLSQPVITMLKNQQQNIYVTNPTYPSYESKYSYDNFTYQPSPSIQQQQQQQQQNINSSSIPTVGGNNDYYYTTTTTTNQLFDSSIYMRQSYIETHEQLNIDKSIYSNTNYLNNSAIYSTNNNSHTTTTTAINLNETYTKVYSSGELDVKIKEYFFKLKLLYPKSIYQTQILMIESVYNIKYNNFKRELNEGLKQFELNNDNNNDERQQQQQHKIVKKRSRSITSNLAQSLCGCSKLNAKRKRSVSINRSDSKRIQSISNEYLTNNLMITLPISSASLNNLNEIIQHKNYYKLERDNLELKYENLICNLQNEILNKIKELQMHIRLEYRLMSIEKQNRQQQQHQQHRQLNIYENDNFMQQKLQISTINANETPIERKIRKRRFYSKGNYTKNNSSFNPINTNNQQLNAIKFYRNINVRETSV